ncbi:MAG TPA: hypothetical protein VG871_24975 [Vicinamibacterales bacterium]|nr:hypothetical protein [Vicinamibacterales bacterium]
MPQLKCDEWPDDEEATTTEQEVPVTAKEVLAIAEFRAHRVTATGIQHPREAGRGCAAVLH